MLRPSPVRWKKCRLNHERPCDPDCDSVVKDWTDCAMTIYNEKRYPTIIHVYMTDSC